MVIRFVTNGTVVVHPGDCDAFARIAAEVVRASRDEGGCLGYSVAQDLLDPTVFHLAGAWEDQSAVDSHLRDAQLMRSRDQLAELRVSSSVVRQWSVSDETTPVIER